MEKRVNNAKSSLRSVQGFRLIGCFQCKLYRDSRFSPFNADELDNADIANKARRLSDLTNKVRNKETNELIHVRNIRSGQDSNQGRLDEKPIP